MHVSVVVLGADAFLAVIHVFTPTAALQILLITDSAAYRAGFQKVGYHMTGIGSPIVDYLVLFPNFGQVIISEHSHLPTRSLTDLDAREGPRRGRT